MNKKLVAGLIGMSALAIVAVELNVKQITEDRSRASVIETVMADSEDIASDDDVGYGDEDIAVEPEDTEPEEEELSEEEEETKKGYEDKGIKTATGSWYDPGLEPSNNKNKTEEVETSDEPEEEKTDESNSSEIKSYDYEKMYVSTDEVNVRKGPGTEYDRLGSLVLNDEVYAAGYNDDWYIVDYDGDVAYINSAYLSDELSGTAMHTRWSDGKVRMRSGPGTNYSEAGWITSKEIVRAIGQEGDWYKVVKDDGTTGYCYYEYLEKGETPSSILKPTEQTESVSQETPVETTQTESTQTAQVSSDIFEVVEANSRLASNAYQNELHDIANELTQNGSVLFATREDADAVFRFYSATYSMTGQDSNCTGTFQTSSTTSNVNLIVTQDINLSDTMTNIVNAIGTDAGDSKYDQMIAMNHRVNRFFTYDVNYANISMDEAIAVKRGVCYHYAHAEYVLLNYMGIPCRLVTGTQNGTAHTWCEAVVGGQTYLLDPTNDAAYKGTQVAGYTEC